MKQSINILTWMSALVLLVCTTTTTQTHTSLEGPLQPRDIKDIASSSDGNTLYAVDKTFLFKSTNGGASWAKTSVELASPLAVVCKPDNADVVVVGISGSLQRNAYGGSSSIWEPVLIESGMVPLRLAVSPIAGQTDYMFLGRAANGGNSSIMVSTNGGASWSTPMTYPSGTSINDIYPYEVSGPKSQHVWAGGSSGTTEGTNPNAPASTRGVWKSTNLGVDWTEKKMGDFNVTAVAVYDAGSNLSLIYAGTASGKLFKSDNDGSTWSQVTTYPTVSAVRAIRIKQESGIVYVASTVGLHRSTDNGGTWTLLKADDVLSFTIPAGSQNTFYLGTPTSVSKSTNASFTWSVINTGLGRMPVSSSHTLSR